MEHTVLHLVGGDIDAREELSRTASALGYDVQSYTEVQELLERAPNVGIVLVAETSEPEGTRSLIARLGKRGISLPLVVTATAIVLERVVDAIRAGAIDYLALPIESSVLAQRLVAILPEANIYHERRRDEVEALRRILDLTWREREVLALLSEGLANKGIANRLEISPRTVEIHRGKMMVKLGAIHPAEAVRAWFAAGDEVTRILRSPEAPPKRRRVKRDELNRSPVLDNESRR